MRHSDNEKVESNFGLIIRPYDTDRTFDPDNQKTQWERLGHKVETLNRESPPEVSYKLLYLGRHGEGYHNVAERRYGTDAWDVRPSLFSSIVSWFISPKLTLR